MHEDVRQQLRTRSSPRARAARFVKAEEEISLAGKEFKQRILPQNSLAREEKNVWSRLPDSCEDGEALSSVHSTALAAGKLIHNLLCDGRVKND